jgi:hypothetical protein
MLVEARGGYALMPEMGYAPVNRYLPPRAGKTAVGCTGAAAELAKTAETAGLHPLLRWMDKVLSR